MTFNYEGCSGGTARFTIFGVRFEADVFVDTVGKLGAERLEALHKMQTEVADREKRIRQLESEWRVREGGHQKLYNGVCNERDELKACIDRAKGLAPIWRTYDCSSSKCADELLAALGDEK